MVADVSYNKLDWGKSKKAHGGRAGGSSRSEVKQEAARENGKKGGKPGPLVVRVNDEGFVFGEVKRKEGFRPVEGVQVYKASVVGLAAELGGRWWVAEDAVADFHRWPEPGVYRMKYVAGVRLSHEMDARTMVREAVFGRTLAEIQRTPERKRRVRLHPGSPIAIPAHAELVPPSATPEPVRSPSREVVASVWSQEPEPLPHELDEWGFPARLMRPVPTDEMYARMTVIDPDEADSFCVVRGSYVPSFYETRSYEEPFDESRKMFAVHFLHQQFNDWARREYGFDLMDLRMTIDRFGGAVWLPTWKRIEARIAKDHDTETNLLRYSQRTVDRTNLFRHLDPFEELMKFPPPHWAVWRYVVEEVRRAEDVAAFEV